MANTIPTHNLGNVEGDIKLRNSIIESTNKLIDQAMKQQLAVIVGEHTAREKFITKTFAKIPQINTKEKLHDKLNLIYLKHSEKHFNKDELLHELNSLKNQSTKEISETIKAIHDDLKDLNVKDINTAMKLIKQELTKYELHESERGFIPTKHFEQHVGERGHIPSQSYGRSYSAEEEQIMRGLEEPYELLAGQSFESKPTKTQLFKAKPIHYKGKQPLQAFAELEDIQHGGAPFVVQGEED